MAGVDPRLAREQVDVEVGVEFVGETLVCPVCGAACPGYDRRRRTWRHMDTMQYRTLVWAEVPRVRCTEHGVQQVRVPRADPRSRFTALFEARVIDWLAVASFRGGGPAMPVELGPGVGGSRHGPCDGGCRGARWLRRRWSG